jgi:hypothetical protein
VNVAFSSFPSFLPSFLSFFLFFFFHYLLVYSFYVDLFAWKFFFFILCYSLCIFPYIRFFCCIPYVRISILYSVPLFCPLYLIIPFSLFFFRGLFFLLLVSVLLHFVLFVFVFCVCVRVCRCIKWAIFTPRNYKQERRNLHSRLATVRFSKSIRLLYR